MSARNAWSFARGSNKIQIAHMNSFRYSPEFRCWLVSLADKIGKARILTRIDSAEAGNFGDCAPVGEGVSEMRIHYGPGYRLYFTRRGQTVCLLLAAGDKSTLKQDIKQAIEMARSAQDIDR